MDLKIKINKLRIVAFSLFFTAVISLLGSIWLHNYIVGFNFYNSFNYETKLRPIPGDFYQTYINCI